MSHSNINALDVNREHCGALSLIPRHVQKLVLSNSWVILECRCFSVYWYFIRSLVMCLVWMNISCELCSVLVVGFDLLVQSLPTPCVVSYGMSWSFTAVLDFFTRSVLLFVGDRFCLGILYAANAAPTFCRSWKSLCLMMPRHWEVICWRFFLPSCDLQNSCAFLFKFG